MNLYSRRWMLLIPKPSMGFLFYKLSESLAFPFASLGIYFPGSTKLLPLLYLLSNSQNLIDMSSSILPIFVGSHWFFFFFSFLYCNFIIVSVGSKDRLPSSSVSWFFHLFARSCFGDILSTG